VRFPVLPGLFSRDVAIVPCDPRVPVASKPRLSRQCLAILDRLEQGDATNRELAALALKYTSRLSDLRAAGYDVRVVFHDFKTGVVRYRLVKS
jgi:hypothetical protein